MLSPGIRVFQAEGVARAKALSIRETAGKPTWLKWREKVMEGKARDSVGQEAGCSSVRTSAFIWNAMGLPKEWENSHKSDLVYLPVY